MVLCASGSSERATWLWRHVLDEGQRHRNLRRERERPAHRQTHPEINWRLRGIEASQLAKKHAETFGNIQRLEIGSSTNAGTSISPQSPPFSLQALCVASPLKWQRLLQSSSVSVVSCVPACPSSSHGAGRQVRYLHEGLLQGMAHFCLWESGACVLNHPFHWYLTHISFTNLSKTLQFVPQPQHLVFDTFLLH